MAEANDREPSQVALGIAHLVYLILGAVRSNQGQLFRVLTIICFRMVN